MRKIANKNASQSIKYFEDFQGSNLKGVSITDEKKPGMNIIYKIISYLTEIAYFVNVYDNNSKLVARCWIMMGTSFSSTTSKQMYNCGLGKYNRKEGFSDHGLIIANNENQIMSRFEKMILDNLLPDNGSEDRQAVRL